MVLPETRSFVGRSIGVNFRKLPKRVKRDIDITDKPKNSHMRQGVQPQQTPKLQGIRTFLSMASDPYMPRYLAWKCVQKAFDVYEEVQKRHD